MCASHAASRGARSATRRAARRVAAISSPTQARPGGGRPRREVARAPARAAARAPPGACPRAPGCPASRLTPAERALPNRRTTCSAAIAENSSITTTWAIGEPCSAAIVVCRSCTIATPSICASSGRRRLSDRSRRPRAHARRQQIKFCARAVAGSSHGATSDSAMIASRSRTPPRSAALTGV